MNNFIKLIVLFTTLVIPIRAFADDELSEEVMAHTLLMEIAVDMQDSFPIDLGNGIDLIGVEFDDNEETFTLFYELKPTQKFTAQDYKEFTELPKIYVKSFNESPVFSVIMNALRIGGYSLVLIFIDWTEDGHAMFTISPEDL